jgi:hypothetical protein
MKKIYPLGVLLTISLLLINQPCWAQFTGFGNEDARFRVGPGGAQGRFNTPGGQSRVNSNGDFNVRDGGFRAGGNIGDIMNGDFGNANFGFGGQNLEASQGDTGAQFRLTDPTGKQADRAQEFFPDVKLAPTWTGEMAHGSVNKAAIPDGGYTFGFGQGATFPVQTMGGVEYIHARDGSGMQGNRQGYGDGFNFGFDNDGWNFQGSVPIFGGGGGGSFPSFPSGGGHGGGGHGGGGFPLPLPGGGGGGFPLPLPF